MAKNVENIVFEAGYITITFSSGPPVRYPISDFLTGAIATADLVDSCVTAAKLANSAVTADKIAAGVVTASKIGALAVTTAKIAANAVTEAKIANEAVQGDQIKAGVVTTSKLGALAVTEAKIAATAVTAAKLANEAVTADKILAAAVTRSKLGLLAVDTPQLAAGAVEAAKLGSSAVTADKIDTGAVTRSKLGADAVDGTKLADDAVAAEHIATLSELTVTSGNIIGQRFWVNHFFSFESGHHDCHIFIATMACKVTAVRFVRSADEYGDLAVVITRTQSTEAPASGDEVVASTDLKALTKDTTTTGTVVTAGQVNELAVGNRLSLNFTGTPYAIIGVITVEMEIMAA